MSLVEVELGVHTTEPPPMHRNEDQILNSFNAINQLAMSEIHYDVPILPTCLIELNLQ